MKNTIFFASICVIMLNVTSNQVRAQSLAISAGPEIPVNDYGDDKPAAYQGNFIRIEGLHYLKPSSGSMP